MRTAHYRTNTFDIEDDTLSIDEIREELVGLFPELETATHTVNGNDIYFDVQVGTKGDDQLGTQIE